MSLSPTHNECCTGHGPSSLFHYGNITRLVWVWVLLLLLLFLCGGVVFYLWSIDRDRNLLLQPQCGCSYVMRKRFIVEMYFLSIPMMDCSLYFPGHLLLCIFLLKQAKSCMVLLISDEANECMLRSWI